MCHQPKHWGNSVNPQALVKITSQSLVIIHFNWYQDLLQHFSFDPEGLKWGAEGLLVGVLLVTPLVRNKRVPIVLFELFELKSFKLTGLTWPHNLLPFFVFFHRHAYCVVFISVFWISLISSFMSLLSLCTVHFLFESCIWDIMQKCESCMCSDVMSN